MADVTQNTSNTSNSGGGFLNSPWAMLLPVALGAASLLSPRVGQGISAGLSGLDWMQKRQKEERRLSSLRNVGSILQKAAAAGQTPDLAEVYQAAGENVGEVLPQLNQIAQLNRPEIVHGRGGAMYQANRTPSGIKLSELQPGEPTEQGLATQRFENRYGRKPTAEELIAEQQQIKLEFLKQHGQTETQIAKDRQTALMPGNIAQAAGTAAAVAPIHIGTAVKTGEATLPGDIKKAKALQDVRDEADIKPTWTAVNQIGKAIDDVNTQLLNAQLNPAVSDDEKAKLLADKERLTRFRLHTIKRVEEKSGLPAETPTQPAAAPQPTNAPGQFAKPTANDLAQYRVIMRSGNQPLIDSTKAKAKSAWGYLP